jgi:hypothetical protein
MHRQAGVAPEELGRLEQPLGAVDGKGRDANELKRSLEQVEVAVDGGLREARVARDLGLVDQAAQPQAGDPHQAPEVHQRGDR